MNKDRVAYTSPVFGSRVLYDKPVGYKGSTGTHPIRKVYIDDNGNVRLFNTDKILWKIGDGIRS